MIWAPQNPFLGIFNSQIPQGKVISVCIQIPEPLQYKIIIQSKLNCLSDKKEPQKLDNPEGFKVSTNCFLTHYLFRDIAGP